MIHITVQTVKWSLMHNITENNKHIYKIRGPCWLHKRLHQVQNQNTWNFLLGESEMTIHRIKNPIYGLIVAWYKVKFIKFSSICSRFMELFHSTLCLLSYMPFQEFPIKGGGVCCSLAAIFNIADLRFIEFLPQHHRYIEYGE